MFNCGTAKFSNMDDQIDLPSTPKSLKKSKNKNPYSTRGLDKFTMVLAELETRREKIMARTGSQGVAMIRFMYNNSQDWVPIIVRPKEQKKIQEAEIKLENEIEKEVVLKKKKKVEEEKAVNKKSFEWLKWKGSLNWLLVMVLILVCLVMFGRVFAICCVSIWWYIVPTMQERSIKKKEYVRRLSDKKLGSPRANHGIIGKKGC